MPTNGKRYLEVFKIEAVKQVVERGYYVSSVATSLDITAHSFYARIKKYGPHPSTNNEQSDAQVEIRRLQKELKRVTDERDRLISSGWNRDVCMVIARFIWICRTASNSAESTDSGG